MRSLPDGAPADHRVMTGTRGRYSYSARSAFHALFHCTFRPSRIDGLHGNCRSDTQFSQSRMAGWLGAIQLFVVLKFEEADHNTRRRHNCQPRRRRSRIILLTPVPSRRR